MKKQFIQNVFVQIKFEYNDEKTELDDAINTAVHLAITPNFGTIEQGVHLTNVQATFNQETINFDSK